MPVENAIWYTPVEIAAMLKINEGTVRRWLRVGALRGSQLGKVWRVGDADLLAFIAAGVPTPAGTPANGPEEVLLDLPPGHEKEPPKTEPRRPRGRRQ
jgi:excisionase family DNA binding protein